MHMRITSFTRLLAPPSRHFLARNTSFSRGASRMREPAGAATAGVAPGGSSGSREQPPAAAGAAAGAAAAGAAGAPAPEPVFTIVSEQELHKRYLTLYNRAVQFPSSDGVAEGPVHEYDIAGHPQCDFHFAVVFPYHSADATVTLIREYAQGLNQMVWCLPTGGYDPRKHASWQACARAELSEEAHLEGGTWQPLVPEEHPGIAEVKWCRNRFHSYLCVDPQLDAQPGKRDHEEFIEVCRVGLPELRRLMVSGDMMLPSVATCFLALERIQEEQQQGQQAAAGGHG